MDNGLQISCGSESSSDDMEEFISGIEELYAIILPDIEISNITTTSLDGSKAYTWKETGEYTKGVGFVVAKDSEFCQARYSVPTADFLKHHTAVDLFTQTFEFR